MPVSVLGDEENPKPAAWRLIAGEVPEDTAAITTGEPAKT